MYTCDNCGIRNINFGERTYTIKNYEDGEGGFDTEATCVNCGTEYYYPYCGECCGMSRTDPDGTAWWRVNRAAAWEPTEYSWK